MDAHSNRHLDYPEISDLLQEKKIKNHKSTSPKLFDHFLCEKKKKFFF